MKIKQLLLALALTAGVSINAQGYRDGIEYFKADQYDNAKEILTKNIDQAGDDRANVLYYLGAIAYHEGKMAEANKYFNEGVSANPKVGLNYVGLGSVLLKNGDAKGAAEQFKAALKADKKAPILVAIARAYYNVDPVGYSADYNKYMEQAMNKDKKCADVYLMRGDKLRDEAIAEGDGSTKIGDAATEYNQAIYFNDKSPEAYVKYSRVYVKVNPEYAIEKLKEVLDRNPQSALVQRELAERYFDNGQWIKAQQTYAEYLKNPNHFVSDKARYTVLLFSSEKYDESLALANEILSSDPKNAQALRIRYLDLDKLGRKEEAKAAAEKFFATPGISFSVNDYTTYAAILDELGLDDQVVAAYEKALAINPEKYDIYKDISTAWSQAGGKASKEGDTAAANADFVKAAAALQTFIDKGEPSTNDYVTLGSRYQNVAATAADSMAAHEAIGKAIAAIDLVIERVPDNHIPVRNKARMLLVKNDKQPSMEQVNAYMKMLDLLNADPENLTKRQSDYSEGYSQIASYYISQKDLPNAIVWYEKMLSLDPTNEKLKEYIERLKNPKKK